MTKSLVNESPRRGTARRVGAGGMALAAVLTLGACKATGGGQIDDPVPGGLSGSFTGASRLWLQFHLWDEGQEQGRDQGPDHLSRHREPASLATKTFRPIRLHGVVDPMVFTAADCETAAQMFLDAAQFEGTYRSQDTSAVRRRPADSPFWCSTRVSRAARKTQHSSPATGSQSS